MTDDFGNEIKVINHDLSIDEIKFHYSEPNLILFSSIINNEYGYENRKVFFTNDYGMNNKFLASNVTQYEW